LSAKLPVSVIIPSLSSIDEAKDHLSRSSEILKTVQQIVVVDSSPAGVIEVFRDAMVGLPAEIYARPKGLYSAWNFAIEKCEAPYIYISTIGDCLHPGGLEYLVDIAKQTQAQVVISPPRMITEGNGVDESIRWPVHDVVAALEEDGEPTVVEGPLAVMLFSSFLPSSVLGSSASNLYRSDILKANPFPESSGPQGDVVWAFKMCPHLRFAFTKNICADFKIAQTHKKLDGQAEASTRIFQELESILDKRFSHSKNSPQMSIARGWANFNWKHFKWTHEYVQWHKELQEWSEKLQTWNAYLDKRDKSFAGRLAGAVNRLMPSNLWKSLRSRS
jgi:hypothetical protein